MIDFESPEDIKSNRRVRITAETDISMLHPLLQEAFAPIANDVIEMGFSFRVTDNRETNLSNMQKVIFGIISYELTSKFGEKSNINKPIARIKEEVAGEKISEVIEWLNKDGTSLTTPTTPAMDLYGKPRFSRLSEAELKEFHQTMQKLAHIEYEVFGTTLRQDPVYVSELLQILLSGRNHFWVAEGELL